MLAPPAARPRRGCQQLLVLMLAACVVTAAAHGTLVAPRSRNFLAYLERNFYLSHGLNAGGNNAVAGYGKLTWPDMQLTTLCGDAPGQKTWDEPGPVQATYTAGQVIDVDAVVAVNHLGRFEVQLCDLAATPANSGSSCTKLERADGKGTLWYLPFLSAGWTGGNNGVDAPAYGDGSFSFYRMPEILAEQGCKAQRFCNQYLGQVVYRTQWRLPINSTCLHCKLSWSYMTAQSCWPPCPRELEGEPTCRNHQVFPECGTPGTTYPEYFMNCADVAVVPAGGAPGAAAHHHHHHHHHRTEAALDGGAAAAASPATQAANAPLWEPSVVLQAGRFGTPAAWRMFSNTPLPGTEVLPAVGSSNAAAALPAHAQPDVPGAATKTAAPAVHAGVAVASASPKYAQQTRAAAGARVMPGKATPHSAGSARAHRRLPA